MAQTGSDSFEELTEASQRASDSISKGLADAILTSRENLNSFGDFAQNIINKIAADLISKALTEPLTESLFKILKVPKVPGFAHGGAVSGGSPVVVGERGPELFVPSSNGQIVPNNQMGGANISVSQVFNISTGAEINLIDEKIRNAAPAIAQQAKAGVFGAIQRGGIEARLVTRKA